MKVSIEAVRKAQEKAANLLLKACDQRQAQRERNRAQIDSIEAHNAELANEIDTLLGQ